jgi:2-dehydro-3-deoxyphosphogluconate aldolase/(4S)-4-hydroxy-2-oxoglutarate aldolase
VEALDIDPYANDPGRWGASLLTLGELIFPILEAAQARSVVEIGAYAGDLTGALVRWAAGRGVATFPGAFTPTEALAAWRAGAAAVKLFPASVAGPAFVREMRGPLPDVPLIATGGVTLDNAPAFIEAGAVAVALGSWLTASGDAAEIAHRARRLASTVAAAAAQR